jgi:hypothetical protein
VAVWAALGALALEGDLRRTPVSDLLARRSSANVVAVVPASGTPLRRVCLCAHMDSSRSGLMFHPRVVRHLAPLVRIPGLSGALLAAGPVSGRLPGGAALRRAAIAGLLFALAMLAERELRGSDVAGASDNGSGCGVAAQLIAECAREPLEHTTVELLISGCEESGLSGAQFHVRGLANEGPRPVFLNFDTVGGDVPLTYILREGIGPARPASPRLVAMIERIALRRPELGLVAAAGTPGLPTDVTVALAHGYEGVTLLAQGDSIPHYHWPTDTTANIARETVAKALEAGRELLRELDAGS